MRRDVCTLALMMLELVGCIGERADSTAGASRPAHSRRNTAADQATAEAQQQREMPTAPEDVAKSSPGDTGETPRPSDPADACQDANVDPGPAPLRRLTPEQYVNTLRDLFGDVPGLAAVLGSSERASELGVAQPDAAPVEIEMHQRAAETVAAYAASTPALLHAIAPCAADTDPRECARAFVHDFGARVYRAPLTAASDIDRHLRLYDAGASVSHAHGIELVLQGMLQAPRFLYRVELGSDGTANPNVVRLSGPEIAARLSYVLWNTLPDAGLDRAARSGKLDSSQGVSEVIDQMLADARGRHAVRDFLERWLHLDKLDTLVKDERLYPEWTRRPTLRASLAEQARRTLDDVLDRKSGSLRALLTSSSVFVNADVAAYYGVSEPDGFMRIELNDGRASGILSLPGLMAVLAKPGESSPVYRGKFVREALLCQMLPAPPPNIPKPPDVQPGVSTRQRLSQHEVDPACSGCHQLMDPIGFGLENYDAIGRFRSTDGRDAIDGRGELNATRDANGTFSGARELGERLAGSAEVQECMTRQWFRFVLARFERDADSCTLQKLGRDFAASGADLRALPKLLLTSDAFLTRRRREFEEMP